MKSELLNKLLGEPICNMCQAFLDDYVEKNIIQREEMGIESVVIRQVVNGCCEWCRSLAGVHNYMLIDKQIFKRHDNCKCIITMKSNKTGYMDIWRTREYKTYKDARIVEHINNIIEIKRRSDYLLLSDEDDKIKENEKKVVINPNKIAHYMLRPGAAHYKDFTDVGFDKNHPEEIRRQILAGYNEDLIEGKRIKKNALQYFTKMSLGVKTKRLFIVSWQIDKPGSKPRLTSCYRWRK